MMNAKQFAWWYLIENGVAGREPSFYGGWDLLPGVAVKFSRVKDASFPEKDDIVRKTYLKDIIKIGVDWNKTESPESDLVQSFAGTMADACDYRESIKGTLVLKNESKQQWCSETIQVTSVFEMMTMVPHIQEKFAKLFGE